jgi:hypothetical protein
MENLALSGIKPQPSILEPIPIQTELSRLPMQMFIKGENVKLSLQHAAEAHRVVRRRGSYIF